MLPKLTESGRTWQPLGDGTLTTESTLEFSETKCKLAAGTYRILPFHTGTLRKLIVNKDTDRTSKKYDASKDLCRLDFTAEGPAVRPVWISPMAQEMQPLALQEMLALGWLRFEAEAEGSIILTGVMIHVIK